MTAIRP